MKKVLALLLCLMLIFSLAACGGDKEENSGEENINQVEQQDEKKEEKKQDEEKSKPKEYSASAWVKDNTSISFYLMYSESKPENELLTLKVLDDKAVLYSKKGENEEKPITIYEETDEGIVTTQLLYIGDAKGAMINLPKADHHELKEYLPKTGNVMMTFGARADKDIYKNAEFTGKTDYIGRKCDVIEKNAGISKQTTYLDRETGIVLKNETVTKMNDKESRVVSCYVTEFEYGKVTEDDVTVDLSEFKVTYEEPEEAEENKED